MSLTALRVGLLAAGLLVWGYGARIGDRRLTLAAIVLLGAALLLRFAGPRQPRRGSDEPE